MSSPLAALSDLTLKGAALSPRWGLSAAAVGNKVYIFGGYVWFPGVEGFFNDLHEIDITTSSLRRLKVADGSPVPCPRFGQTLVADSARNQIILFGGRSTTESFNDVWIYCISRNQWTQLGGGSPPSPSTSPSLTSGAAGAPGSVTDDLQSSRKSDKKSSKRSDRSSSSRAGDSTPPPERSWHSATVHRTAVYIYGGWDHSNRVFNDLWCFDLLTHTWMCINPPDAMSKPPHGRSCHQAVSWSECLFVFGGLRDGEVALCDMWRFSFEAKTWAPVEFNGPRPGGRTSPAGAVIGDSWILHGGLTDTPRSGMPAMSDVWEFNFSTNTWIQRPLLLSDGCASSAQRYGHAVVPVPSSSALILLGGAEKHGTPCQTAICRVDLLPSQAQVLEMQQELLSATRLSQMNRERISELVEAVQAYELQLRQSKLENGSLSERCQALQTQMASLHQQQSALQAAFTTVQQELSALEQFIPMMRSVGAAIANFGNGGWAAPGSSGSLSRANTGGPAGPTKSSNELR